MFGVFSNKAIFAAVLLALITGHAYAVVVQDFARYDIILSRKPFGEPPAPAIVQPPAPPPNTPPPPPKDPFNKHLGMAAITDDEGGIHVGLFNKNTKASFFLVIGETTEDGITLVNADYEGEGALLRKGDEECWMYMDGRNSKSPLHTSASAPAAETANVPVPASAPAAEIANAPAPSPLPAEGTVKAPSAKMTNPLSYVDRLRMRREATQQEEQKKIEVAAEAAASRKVDAIDRNDLLRKYNLDLIRAKGAKGAPLPIQLTPEEDAMLVKEGVLPPQE